MAIDILKKKFSLSDSFLEGLKDVEFKYIDYEPTEYIGIISIDPKKIVGTYNKGFDFGSLFEFYDSFHKEALLNDLKFDNAIVNPITGQFPEVVEVDGKYYLSDGRHRVILSQLKDLKLIKVSLYK